MSSATQESGGIGGKFRKRRPLRRSAATPYGRPPETTTRASGIRIRAPGAERNGWISWLIDPASRVIARGASKLFSSMFQKRLTGPPVRPVDSSQPCLEAPAIVNVVQQQSQPQSLNINSSAGVAEQRGVDECTTKVFDNTEISKLEQLLKQKTFTRAEFERLSELLRSRTVELDVKETALYNPLLVSLGKEESPMPSGSVATPSGTTSIPEETIASPSEMAKAYVKSKSSILPVSMLAVHNQAFHEEATSLGTKASDTPIPTRSLRQFSGSTECPDNGYFTPQPLGRSAIYKMSRSPYFNIKSTTNVKTGPLQRDGFTVQSTPSQWTPTGAGQADGKQASKRGRLLLENDLGYFGPVRQTRQKTILSPSKEQSVPGSSKFLLKPHEFMPERGYKDLDTSNSVPPASDDQDLHIPVQSSVMASKILKQLDKLPPSSKELSSELKSIPREATTSKVTPNLFHWRDLRSTEDIKSSVFVGTQSGNLNMVANESSFLKRPLKHHEVQENGPSVLSGSQDKAPFSNSFVDSVISSEDGQPLKSVAKIRSSNPVKVVQHGKPSFIISTPEDSAELDDNDFSGEDKQGLESFEFIAPSGSIPNSFSIPFRDFDGKAPEQPASISSAATVVSCADALEPPLSILGSQKSLKKMEEETPLFAFGSKGSHSVSFSAIASEASVQNTGGEFFQEAGLLSRSTMSANQLESFDSDKEIKAEKSEKSFKGLGDSVLADVPNPSSPTFTFGASTSPSTGVLNSKQSPISFNAASKNSDGVLASRDFNINSSFGSSMSSTAPVFSTLTTFQFGASGSTGANSTPPADVKPGFQNAEIKPVKESIFSFTNTNSTTIPTNFPSSVSSNLVAVSQSNSTNLLASNMFSNMESGSSGLATVSSFSGSTASFSPLPSSLFSSMSSNIFSPRPHLQSGSSSFSFNSSTMSSVSSVPPASSSGGISNLSQIPSQQISFSSAPSFKLAGAPSFGFGSSSFGSFTNSARPFGAGSEFSTFASAASGNSFSTGFGSTSSSPFPSFGNPASTASSGVIFAFGSSAPAFSMPNSLGSRSGSLFSSTQSAFGIASHVSLFGGSGVAPNDQTNADDSMTDDTAPASAAPNFPNFEQSPSNSTPNFMFGSSAAPSNRTPFFQFSGQQSPVPQYPNPFQPAGVMEFTSSGSFSLGSGGSDKSNRRIVKVRRDKLRRK